jgi:hypothetical protein
LRTSRLFIFGVCAIGVLCRPSFIQDLFGRAPAPAPRAAPAGALPNGGNCTGSGCGAGAGASRGFQRGGGATFWWLHLAPTRNPPEELFCQTFFKTTQLHQRSHSTRGARAGAVFGGAGALPNTPSVCAVVIGELVSVLNCKSVPRGVWVVRLYRASIF